MKLNQLLEQLNKLAKENPKALELKVFSFDFEYGHVDIDVVEIIPASKPTVPNFNQDYIVFR
jgi:hypothetical protein